jgi:hypothetical protein
VPGTYIAGEPLVTIAAFASQLHVISSKQRPRKLTIHGGDGAEYMFLLKVGARESPRKPAAPARAPGHAPLTPACARGCAQRAPHRDHPHARLFDARDTGLDATLPRPVCAPHACGCACDHLVVCGRATRTCARTSA